MFMANTRKIIRKEHLDLESSNTKAKYSRSVAPDILKLSNETVHSVVEKAKSRREITNTVKMLIKPPR